MSQTGRLNTKAGSIKIPASSSFSVGGIIPESKAAAAVTQTAPRNLSGIGLVDMNTGDYLEYFGTNLDAINDIVVINATVIVS